MTPEQRTMQLLRDNERVRRQAAFNHWAAQRGNRMMALREMWSSMPEEARQQAEDDMLRHVADYHALSPAERRMAARVDIGRLLSVNDGIGLEEPS